MPEVAIIGAGPAGSTAAVLLARAGWDVTIIEQHRFPRDKVCGECVSALGYDVLDRTGLTPEFHRAAPVQLTSAAIHSSEGRSLSVALPQAMWGLSRRVFDPLLLDAAARGGARVLQPARCEGITPGGAGPPQACVRDLRTNQIRTLAPHVVLTADGKGGSNPPPPRPTGDFGIKAHFVDVEGPGDAIELFSTTGHYGGLAPIEANRWNAAFSVRARDLRECRGDVGALFGRLRAGNRTLAGRLARARQIGPWLASPLPRFAVASDWPKGVIPLGNAAAALEPIGGEGMGLAMRSAELAAEALIRCGPRWTEADAAALRAGYRRLWRTRRAVCRAAAVAVSSPGWSGRLLPVVECAPWAVQMVLALMGKGGRKEAASTRRD